MGLKPKQQKFVLEYLKDFNQRQACIRAGYSEKSAHNQADRMMKNDDVKIAIADALQEIKENSDYLIEEIHRKILQVMRFNVADLFDDAGHPRELKDIPNNGAIQSVSYYENGNVRSLRLHDFYKASNILLLHKGEDVVNNNLPIVSIVRAKPKEPQVEPSSP